METTGGSALTVKARELIVAADRKRVEQFIANAKAFSWDLDIWMRGLSSNEQASWQLHIAKLKALVRNARVPATVPESSGIKLSPKMAQICAHATQKQEAINNTFLAEVTKIRQAYQTKLKAEVKTAEDAGKLELGTALREEFRKASDNVQWLKAFGIDPPAGAIGTQGSPGPADDPAATPP